MRARLNNNWRVGNVKTRSVNRSTKDKSLARLFRWLRIGKPLSTFLWPKKTILMIWFEELFIGGFSHALGCYSRGIESHCRLRVLDCGAWPMIHWIPKLPAMLRGTSRNDHLVIGMFANSSCVIFQLSIAVNMSVLLHLAKLVASRCWRQRRSRCSYAIWSVA